MRTDDPLGLADFYEQRRQLIAAVTDLRQFAKLATRRTSQRDRLTNCDLTWVLRSVTRASAPGGVMRGKVSLRRLQRRDGLFRRFKRNSKRNGKF